MKVEVWAYTVLAPVVLEQLAKSAPQVTDIDHLHEASGRACYESWQRPRPETAENVGYMANILAQGHESVLEHGSVSFRLTGISRSLSHELVRHRHLSFSQLSQRYVDESDTEFVCPPALAEDWEAPTKWERTDINGTSMVTVGEHWRDAVHASREAYEELVKYLERDGFSRKQAREAARAVLPNATETRMVVTGNLRAWRDVLKKRWHVAADAEIRALAGEILRHLRVLAPASVQDLPDQPYGTKAAA